MVRNNHWSSYFFIKFEMLFELEESYVGKSSDVISPEINKCLRDMEVFVEKTKKRKS